jgi:hypothetical protein
MAALREFLAETNIPVKDIERLFFDRYPYRLQLNAKRYVEKTLPRSQWFQQRFAGRRIAESYPLTGAYQTRTEGGITSMFFENEEDALMVLREHHAFVGEVSCPESSSEIALLSERETMMRNVIRKTLFWGQYRIAITFKPLRDALGEIEEWLARDCIMHGGEKRMLFSYSFPRRLYLSDDHELMAFAMSFKHTFLKVEKAFLKGEFQ